MTIVTAIPSPSPPTKHCHLQDTVVTINPGLLESTRKQANKQYLEMIPFTDELSSKCNSEPYFIGGL